MKKIFSALLAGILLSSCGGGKKQDDSLKNATITVIDEGAQEGGLDLQALGELVKKSPDPAKLEEALNKPGSINNLDLDSNGKVDFLKVTEYSDGNTKGLKFIDDLPNGRKEEIADIKINKGSADQADMDISGSPAVYGPDASYHSHFSIGEVLLLAYLFRPHMPYFSPYGYGAYPGYYSPYSRAPMGAYRRTVTTETSHPIGTVATSRYGGRSISGSHSQRSFTTRSSSRSVGSGGFGSRRSSSGSSSSYHSGRSSGRSSFGRSRRH